MDLTTSHLIQLLVALLAGLIVYVLIFILPERTIVSALILLSPFQFVDSRYGSANVVLTYMVAFAFLIKGRLRWVPLMYSFLLLCTAYLLAFLSVPNANVADHAFYLISIGSNVLIFLITYNFTVHVDEPRFALKIFIWLNAIVALYCAVQLFTGFDEHFSLGGISGLSLRRAWDGRLTGPFKGTEMIAEYFALQIIFLAYLLLKGDWRRKWFFSLLIAANFGFIIASGTRGGLFTLAFGGGLFVFFYRKAFSMRHILMACLLIPLAIAAVSFVIIRYTKFDTMFERLAETRIEGGVPDTRKFVWTVVWQASKQKPIFGHGPRFRLQGDKWIEEKKKSLTPDITPYPHSLYLFLFYTLGACGLFAYAVFGLNFYVRLKKGMSTSHREPFLAGLPRLGSILFLMFLFDEIKIDFLRYMLSDFQHYIFALFAVFLGLSDVLCKGRHDRNAKENMLCGD